MPIYARAPESRYKAAPEGLYQAVCVDVWEPWTEENPFQGGLVDKTRVVWQLDEEDPATKRRYEVSQLYTVSLHPKSNLCRHLESWRARAFTDEERMGFDLEKLIGVNCQLQIVHRLSKAGRTFANVAAIVPLGKTMTKIRPTDDFVRRKDRQAKPGPSGQHDEGMAIDDSDVPF